MIAKTFGMFPIKFGEKKKWKRKLLSRVQLFATPWIYSPWNSPGQNAGVGSRSLVQGIDPRSHELQADSLPDEPQGKPKNTGVGSLSFIQWIFLT